MIRLLPVIAFSALLLTGCATPTPGAGPSYGSAAQQQRMEQDTTMGSSGGNGSGWGSGQGYKGDTGSSDGKTAAKF